MAVREALLDIDAVTDGVGVNVDVTDGDNDNMQDVFNAEILIAPLSVGRTTDQPAVMSARTTSPRIDELALFSPADDANHCISVPGKSASVYPRDAVGLADDTINPESSDNVT